MLDVADLEAGYGPIRALHGVSFAVDAGSITAILGANGAGKTTLLRALCGQISPARGRISLVGRDITTERTDRIARLGVAHVPEGGGVIAELTVEENLRLGGLWRTPDKRLGIDKVIELFAPLGPRLKLPANTLSGGERQMLAIGRALMQRPRLLLLDEPSLGLAPRVAADTMRLLRMARDEHDLTVLLVEQNAKSALSVADRALVLHVGTVVADDAPAALAGDEQLRHAYLGF